MRGAWKVVWSFADWTTMPAFIHLQPKATEDATWHSHHPTPKTGTCHETRLRRTCVSPTKSPTGPSIRLYNSIRSLGRGSVPDYLMDMVLDLEDSFRSGRAILPTIQRLQTSLTCHLDCASCVIPKRALFFLSFPIRISFRASNATLDNRTSEVSHYSASGFRHVKICRNDITPYDCAIRALAKQF